MMNTSTISIARIASTIGIWGSGFGMLAYSYAYWLYDVKETTLLVMCILTMAISVTVKRKLRERR